MDGSNTLAIRAINATSSSNDLLILPELVTREVMEGIDAENRVYYTTDGTDPRGPDGRPSATATELVGGGSVTIDTATRLIVRNLDASDRGREAAIVRTDWSGAVSYDLRIGQPIRGDVSGDGRLNEDDIDLLSRTVAARIQDRRFDMNDDQTIDQRDRDEWVERIFGTSYGDANLDGVFDSADLVHVQRLGEFKDATGGNSTWSEGDWNGDGEFDTSDLVLAFQRGMYV